MLLQRQVTGGVNTDLDLTPMVDVIFQLLTFLLLTYQPTPGEIDVPVARHGIGVERDEAVVLSIEPPTTAGGEAIVKTTGPGGATVTLESAEAIREAVTAGVREDRRRVILEADGSVPHGEILRIAAAAAEVEGVILHIGVEEPK